MSFLLCSWGGGQVTFTHALRSWVWLLTAQTARLSLDDANAQSESSNGDIGATHNGGFACEGL
jgi:hypothetical protein